MIKLKQWIISSFFKNYPLKELNIRDSTVEVFKISEGSHHTNKGLS